MLWHVPCSFQLISAKKTVNEKLVAAPYLFGQNEGIVSWVFFAAQVSVCFPACCVTQPMKDLLIPSSSKRFGRQWQERLGNPL